MGEKNNKLPSHSHITFDFLKKYVGFYGIVKIIYTEPLDGHSE